MKALNRDSKSVIPPDTALPLLKDGNGRFVSNLKIKSNLPKQVYETRNSQWPFGKSLSCIEHRSAAGLKFDKRLGDIFSIRIDGNNINEDFPENVEFVDKSKLVAVPDHSNYAAIRGVCENVSASICQQHDLLKCMINEGQFGIVMSMNEAETGKVHCFNQV